MISVGKKESPARLFLKNKPCFLRNECKQFLADPAPCNINFGRIVHIDSHIRRALIHICGSQQIRNGVPSLKDHGRP